ncbi:MAG: SDR family NAD(P)-dependent oxidoreductase [Tatlockia sp.]|nr:SDR family NAD(P)-dependent oxidoreductase [Tatlockia sp.]
MKFKNKNIVITGGSNGLGKAIVLNLAKQGANIIITYNSDLMAANKVIE